MVRLLDEQTRGWAGSIIDRALEQGRCEFVNRDEDAFEDPFRFDLGRTPNPHIAFGGGGPRYCLGASMARREITIFFEELLARTSDVEILEPPVHAPLSIDNPVVVAVKELQVRLS